MSTFFVHEEISAMTSEVKVSENKAKKVAMSPTMRQIRRGLGSATAWLARVDSFFDT